MSLDFANDIPDAAAFLSAKLGKKVEITFTDNRRNLISAKRGVLAIELRLHHIFQRSDAITLDAIAASVQGTCNAAQKESLHAYVRANRELIKKPKERKVVRRTRGTFHDLQEMFDEIEGNYFDRAIVSEITWGKRINLSSRRYSIRLGSYTAQEKLIRIHPVLDQKWVPSFYVASVVYHEMLHVVVPPERQGSNIITHTREFQRREALFEDFAASQKWENDHLDRLLGKRAKKEI